MRSKTSNLAFAAVAQFRSVGLRKGVLASLCLALCTVGLSLSDSAQGPTFTIFDPPGAIITKASSINPAGAITGTYYDGLAFQGFLRAPDGSFTTFRVPGAPFFTEPTSINPAGAITGTYIDANILTHGFLRTP